MKWVLRWTHIHQSRTRRTRRTRRILEFFVWNLMKPRTLIRAESSESKEFGWRHQNRRGRCGRLVRIGGVDRVSAPNCSHSVANPNFRKLVQCVSKIGRILNEKSVDLCLYMFLLKSTLRQLSKCSLLYSAIAIFLSVLTRFFIGQCPLSIVSFLFTVELSHEAYNITASSFKMFSIMALIILKNR